MTSHRFNTRKWANAALSLLFADAAMGCHGGETIYGKRSDSAAAGHTGQMGAGGVQSSGHGGTTIGSTGKGGDRSQSYGGTGGYTTRLTETGGNGGVAATGGSSGSATGGDTNTGGSSIPPQGGSAGSDGGAPAGGSSGASTAGASTAGASTAGAPPFPPLIELVTSAQSAYWRTDGTLTEVTSETADVTVDDSTTAQTWDGFGGAFNELGWSYLTTQALQDQAMQLLFGADGAHFAWGRIPIGATDFAMSRYTPDDTATPDPVATSESVRPAGDPTLSNFSLRRDEEKLIPYIKAAQAARSDLRFWACPWTPPVWMKTGYRTEGNPRRPSFFDGGNMTSDAATLAAYAQYFAKFVQGYRKQGINIEIVSPQNEPGYEQNYPSCLWDKATYTTFIGRHLGPAMLDLGVKLMLGTMSNPGDMVAGQARQDTDIADAVLADSTAKTFLAVAGAQWGVLEKVNQGQTFGDLPIWASEHKCGNYPWNPARYPTYNALQAPNDHAYGVESWGYIRDAITKGKVTAYNTWNMVLDRSGLGIDTTRDWKQNALLVVNGGTITKTPAYWVFRHLSQFAAPGGKVVATTASGVDAIGFKNPDGSLVAVIYNSGPAKSTFTVSIGAKKLQFGMPSNGWATVYWHN